MGCARRLSHRVRKRGVSALGENGKMALHVPKAPGFAQMLKEGAKVSWDPCGKGRGAALEKRVDGRFQKRNRSLRSRHRLHAPVKEAELLGLLLAVTTARALGGCQRAPLSIEELLIWSSLPLRGLCWLRFQLRNYNSNSQGGLSRPGVAVYRHAGNSGIGLPCLADASRSERSHWGGQAISASLF